MPKTMTGAKQASGQQKQKAQQHKPKRRKVEKQGHDAQPAHDAPQQDAQPSQEPTGWEELERVEAPQAAGTKPSRGVGSCGRGPLACAAQAGRCCHRMLCVFVAFCGARAGVQH